jgi:hypothetical protein
MTIRSNDRPSVEEVLRDYSSASHTFDPAALNDFLHRYPEYSESLVAYTSVWLMSARATSEEIQAEEVPAAEMLSIQSKALALLHQVKQQTPVGTAPNEALSHFDSVQSGKRSTEETTRLEAVSPMSPVFEVIESLKRTTTDASRSRLRAWLESLLGRDVPTDVSPKQMAFRRLIYVTEPIHAAARASTDVIHVNLVVSKDERVEINWDKVSGSVDIRPMRRDGSPLLLCVVDADIGEPVELVDESGHLARMLIITDQSFTAHGAKFKNPVFVLFGKQ